MAVFWFMAVSALWLFLPFSASKGVSILIEALKKERKRYAVEANLFRLGVVSYATERAAKKYDKITAEIERLEGKRR